MEPSEEVRSWLPKCANCGSDYVNVNWEHYLIPYGVHVVINIPVVQPVNYCMDCNFSYTDWRGEEIRDAAVKVYEKALDILKA